MPSFKKILRYRKHYGTKATVGLIVEKLFTDPKRFSVKKKRLIPDFPINYNSNEINENSSINKKLNILYLIHYFYPTKQGGTERFTLNLAKEQKRLGNIPTVLVLDANEPLSAYSHSCGDILYRYYEYDGISCIGFRHRRAPLGLYYKEVRLCDEVMRTFARHIVSALKIDLVHATYPQPFASFLGECSNINIPYIITCTDFSMMCHFSSLVDKRGDFCVSSENGKRCEAVCKSYGCKNFAKRKENARKVLLDAKAVTVPSVFVARILSSEFADVKFSVVPHGISDAFKSRERNGYPKKFVYAGTLSALKGVHLLLEAFSEVEGDITLDIYGDGDPSYVKTLKKTNDRRVRLHGAVSGNQMPEIYASADCVIVPSMWYETYNFVLREALKSGALVIASDIGAMPEAVEEGKNGFIFTPANKESLAEKIRIAKDFNFLDYKFHRFPTPADEALTYQKIYAASITEHSPPEN